MRIFLMSAAFALSLTACDWNTDHDYHPKAEFKAFVKKQEAAAHKAAEAAGEHKEGADAAASEHKDAPAAAAPAADAPAADAAEHK